MDKKTIEQQLRVANHDLGERVKQLNCLYDLSHLVDSTTSLNGILQGICNIIKESWQYPDITCVRIITEDKVYNTANFKTSQWKQSAGIIVENKIYGHVEIFYLENMPELDEGPFLKEERLLIGTLVERLGKIVKRIQVEEALRASKEKHRGLTENLPQKIFHKDADLVYVSCNKSYARDLGLLPDEIAGKSDFDFYPRELAEKYRANDRRVMELGKTVEFEESYIKDGQELFVQTVKTPLTDDAGNVIGILGIFWDITVRKQAEEAMRESEERFRLLSENTSDTIWTTDLEFNLTYVNKAVSNYLGYSPDEFLKLSSIDFTTPETISIIQVAAGKLLSKFKEGNFSQEREVVRQIKKDGTIIDVEITASVYPNSKGEAIGFQGRSIDITERKQAEEALKESEIRFKNLSNLTFEGILIHNKGVAIDLNESLTRILGYTREELIGENVAKLCIVQDYHETIFQNIAKKYAKPYEVMGIKKDGTHFPVEIEARDIKSNNSEFRVIAIRDITERKKAEEANARLLRAIEQADETIVITDVEGTIQYVNPAFEKITGYSAEEAIGQNPKVLKSDQHDDAFYKNMWEELSRGNRWSGEIINKKKDGTLYVENTVISPVFDSQGIIVNYVAAKNDITEIKRLQELESRAERLETAGTIAGQVAHDFNNLLAPLMAYPEFIREELPRNHPTLKYLDQIEKAAQKIADINQQLLTLGRRGHYNQDVLNLNTIIRQSVKDMGRLADNVTCETDLDSDLMNILAGGSQIHRVISNLLCNAVDALQGIGYINIKTENYYADDVSGSYVHVPKGEYVKLTISDTGCGISDDIVQKIFDPFFSTKVSDKQHGSSLGLSVVDAVVKDHNGYLDLKTRSGKGTSFYIYFPTTRKSSDEDYSDKISGGSETILIVDDDDIQRDVSTQILKRLGYEVNSVESGEKAIEFLRESPQDLLMLDMIMPGGIDGVETYKQIIEINPNQKAIIVSGFSESDRVKVAQDLGAGAFVKKPLTKKAVAVAVRTELDRKVEVSV